MPDNNIKIGTHDAGVWDVSNNVIANKTPLASARDASEAIAKAKAAPGAELVIVDETGYCKVHSVNIDNNLLSSENKKIKIIDLDLDPAEKLDNDKTPLSLDDNLAGKFGGKAVFLVDEDNKVTYLGNDTDKTDAKIKVSDAVKMFNNPNPAKADAAYLVAGNENVKDFETKITAGIKNELLKDFKNQLPTAENNVSLLKPGTIKSGMEKLISDLKVNEKQNIDEVKAQEQKLAMRTDKLNNDLAKPEARLNKANTAWEKAFAEENQKVDKAFTNHREATMPGIHKLESDLKTAESDKKTSFQNLTSETNNRENAQIKLNSIESMPGEIKKLKAEIERLKQENNGMPEKLRSYLKREQSEVESDIRSKKSKISSEERSVSSDESKISSKKSDLRNEEAKPAKTGKNTDDPFKTRSSSKISSLKSDIRSLESDISSSKRKISGYQSDLRELKAREEDLSNIISKINWSSDKMPDIGYSNKNDLSYTQKNKISGFYDKYEDNNEAIDVNNKAAKYKQNYYDKNIVPAKAVLSQAKISESEAKNIYENNVGRVNLLSGQIESLKANPLPDSNPKVKPFAITYKNSLDHKEKKVGENAPLTKEKNSAGEAVNEINNIYSTDKKEILKTIEDSNKSSYERLKGLIQGT